MLQQSTTTLEATGAALAVAEASLRVYTARSAELETSCAALTTEVKELRPVCGTLRRPLLR